MLKKIATREIEEEKKATQKKREEFGFNMWNLAPLKPEDDDAVSAHHTDLEQTDSESETESESLTEADADSQKDQKPSAVTELQKLVKKKKKDEKRI